MPIDERRLRRNMAASLLQPFPLRTLTLISPQIRRNCSLWPFHPLPSRRVHTRRLLSKNCSVQSGHEAFPFTGTEEALMGFITGKRKATEVAHSVWRSIICKGDVVVDATCGNGYDTLALLKLVSDGSGSGCVYGMDVQNSALENTSSLLDISVDENERKQVKLFNHCHSKMEDIVPKDIPVRVVAFNLGYLPGGDKAIITVDATTLPAIQAASRILCSGGLISVIAYVGHPGGREEFQTVKSFASSLLVDAWVSCKLQMLNRPTSPILVLIFKK